MILQVKLRQAVRWVTGHENRGLLLETEIDAMIGQLVADVLASKHPDPMPPAMEVFYH